MLKNKYYVGVAKRNITPSKPLLMAGYILRKSKSSCKIDDLYVRSLFLEDENNNRLLILSLDLIRIDNDLYKEIVNKIVGKTGLKFSEIHIAATHTHAGPEISTSFWNTLPLTSSDIEEITEYRQQVIEASVEASLNALSNVKKTRLFVGRTLIENVASNRVKPGGIIDPEALYIFGKNNNKIEFIAINYACHPTVLGPENTCISGDLAGRVALILEKKLNTNVFYFNGAAGNISTRYTRKAQNFECLEILAQKVADPIYKSIKEHKYEEINKSSIETGLYKLVLRTKRINNDIRKIKELMMILEEQIKNIKVKGVYSPEIRNIESKYEGLKVLLNRINDLNRINQIEAYIGYARIGEKVIMLFFPGEAYVELQLMAKEVSKYPYLFFVGYANGYIGYVPIDKWDLESSLITYEKIVSIINTEEIERIKDIIKKIIS